MDPYIYISIGQKDAPERPESAKKTCFYVGLFFFVTKYLNFFLLKRKEVNQCKLLFTKIRLNKEFKNTYILLVKIKELSNNH